MSGTMETSRRRHQPKRWIAGLPLRKKLILVIVATSATSLLLASGAFLSYEYFRERRELVTSLNTMSQIITESMRAAVAFDDPEAASETLGALRGETAITAGCAYKMSGLLAEYVQYGAPRCPSAPGPDGDTFDESYLHVVNPMVVDGKRIGTVYLRAPLTPMYNRLWREILILLSLFVAAGLFAFALSSRLEHLISRPVLDLARTAESISQRKDYSIRAVKRSDDELGTLVDAFNEMLTQIEYGKTELEERVRDRTTELQNRNEALDRSNKELDDFAYIASHDLKEPLRGIHNYASFLLEDYADKLDDEGRMRLLTLTRLSQRMETLINSLLDYSRVGRVELAIGSTDLNQTVADVLESLDIRLNENRIDVRIPRPLPTVLCDRVRVAEVYRNLITNAMKYNESPDKWIEIGYLDKQDRPVLYVRDNGIGIPRRHHMAVFRIFKRLHGRDKFGGGTGAGLTIVKKVIERHHGEIWLESDVNSGTTFYFTLQGQLDRDVSYVATIHSARRRQS